MSSMETWATVTDGVESELRSWFCHLLAAGPQVQLNHFRLIVLMGKTKTLSQIHPRLVIILLSCSALPFDSMKKRLRSTVFGIFRNWVCNLVQSMMTITAKKKKKQM